MTNTSIQRILITPGEPAGIGPDVTIQIAQQSCAAELIVIADPQLLTERAEQLGLPLKLLPFDEKNVPTIHRPGELKIIPVKLNSPCTPGQLNIKNAPYVIQTLKIATELCLQKKADALVTGPVHKAHMNDAAIPFSGHTEFLAQLCGVKQSLMLFVVNKTKVALLTTHIPLSQVPKVITAEKILSTARLLHCELQNKFHITQPKILVCGLNPHAGENGHLGHEEIEVITPAIKKLQAEGIAITGPFPADTIFTPSILNTADVILAMYHDQALPVVKYIGFDSAVNVTLGLPIIRTSVDHGTALDLAGTGQTNAGSLSAAINLALQLSIKEGVK